MKLFILASLLILIQGCSDQDAVIEEKLPLVVQTYKVTKHQNTDIYKFPAVVSAVKNLELKFEVAGRLITTNLVKGKRVQKGQVLAQIDPAPYRRKVQDRIVRHNLATKEQKRLQALFKKGLISQSIVDNANSLFETTLLDLNNAKQDLSYCKIIAPFDAYVSDRYIDNNSYVQVGVSVATLQDRSTIYFSFDVPERVMTSNVGNTNFKASAVITGLDDYKYDLHYVEHKAKPDPITQTYNVTFAINDVKEYELTPGSRAIVTVINQLDDEEIFIVPLSALVGDDKIGFNVWLLDGNTNTVNKKHVNVLGLKGNFAIIKSGLNEGDKVISAGINQLRVGLPVSEYKVEL